MSKSKTKKRRKERSKARQQQREESIVKKNSWWEAECPKHGVTPHLEYLGGRCEECHKESLNEPFHSSSVHPVG